MKNLSEALQMQALFWEYIVFEISAICKKVVLIPYDFPTIILCARPLGNVRNKQTWRRSVHFESGPIMSAASKHLESEVPTFDSYESMHSP